MSNQFPKAYWIGADAYLKGEPLESNPYPKGSKNWLWWRRGWHGE